jgi:type VI secretion system protein ImpH
MGLTGPSGVLPSVYTELVESRRHHHQDSALHAFLDVFSHRAVSLFYLAWLKHRFYLGAEQGLQDGFSRDLMALLGLGLEARTTREGLDGLNGTCLHFGGILGRRPLPSGSLRAVVEGHLGVPVALEQFVCHWVQVAGTDQSRLGAGARDGLGQGTFLGVRQRDAQTSIRLLLGPLDARQFRDFLPDGKGGSDLSTLMFDLLGPTMRVEVRLILRRSEVPPPRMGQPGGLSLGRNLWLFSTPPDTDQDDAIYELDMEPL